MKTKILLINAIRPNIELEQRHPSLGLAYLVSALRNHFGRDYFEFRIIDRGVEKEISHFKPEVVLISSVTQNFDVALNYGRLLKQKQIPVIIGGIHISMMPSSLNSSFDVGVMGEGEETIVELMEVFLSHRNKFTPGDLSKIKGIIYRDGDSVHFT